MDAWTSPNHKAFVAVSMHFEHDGKPICIILDVVEVANVSTVDLLIVHTVSAQATLCIIGLYA